MLKLDQQGADLRCHSGVVADPCWGFGLTKGEQRCKPPIDSETERHFFGAVSSSAQRPVGWLPKLMLPITTLPAAPGSKVLCRRARLGNLFHVDPLFGWFLPRLTLFCTSLAPRDDLMMSETSRFGWGTPCLARDAGGPSEMETTRPAEPSTVFTRPI